MDARRGSHCVIGSPLSASLLYVNLVFLFFFYYCVFFGVFCGHARLPVASWMQFHNYTSQLVIFGQMRKGRAHVRGNNYEWRLQPEM